ncbi:MAG: hypothetical protein Q9213_004596 [Squamulea squamosa]
MEFGNRSTVLETQPGADVGMPGTDVRTNRTGNSTGSRRSSTSLDEPRMQDKRKAVHTPDPKAELHLRVVHPSQSKPIPTVRLPSHKKPIPIVRLPPMPVKAPTYQIHDAGNPANGVSSLARASRNYHGGLTPLAAPESWQNRFKQLTSSVNVRQQRPPSPILYDAFGDPIIASISHGSTVTDSAVPEEDKHDHQDSGTSTPSTTIAETLTASISSQTAALLMQGAKANWENICEALLVGVSLDDKEILTQIMLLVNRLGTGTGPLSLAHQPCFESPEVTTAVNVDTASVCTKRLVEEPIGIMIKGAATPRAIDVEEAGKEDEEELQARKERIASSLLMRRQEQPIRK